MTAPLSYPEETTNLLTEQGFTTSNLWYHGTSSALVDSILEQGLLGSGDTAFMAVAKKTMATLGDQYSETKEPVFLTPSKALAYYWAEQTVKKRRVRFEGEEKPVVLEITLPEDLNQKVRSDVGAASLLLLEEGEHYLAYLAGLYQAQGLELPIIDLMKAERSAYLKQLGMAYIEADLPASCIRLVNL